MSSESPSPRGTAAARNPWPEALSSSIPGATGFAQPVTRVGRLGCRSPTLSRNLPSIVSLPTESGTHSIRDFGVGGTGEI